MKVSKEIKDKMHKAAKCFAESNRLMRDIEDYLESCGINVDEVRCGNGCSLEEFEYGNDVTDEFVEWIEEKLNSSFSH